MAQDDVGNCGLVGGNGYLGCVDQRLADLPVGWGNSGVLRRTRRRKVAWDLGWWACHPLLDLVHDEATNASLPCLRREREEGADTVPEVQLRLRGGCSGCRRRRLTGHVTACRPGGSPGPIPLCQTMVAPWLSCGRASAEPMASVRPKQGGSLMLPAGRGGASCGRTSRYEANRRCPARSLAGPTWRFPSNTSRARLRRPRGSVAVVLGSHSPRSSLACHP
jgi:hypothetical protein